MIRKRNKIFILFLLGGVVFCIGITYYWFIVAEEFFVSYAVSCDPTEENCYYWVCEPDYLTECTGDIEEDFFTYKFVKKKAKYFSACDPVIKQKGFLADIIEEGECPEPSCEVWEGCEIVYCNPEIEEECYSEDMYSEIEDMILKYAVENKDREGIEK